MSLFKREPVVDKRTYGTYQGKECIIIQETSLGTRIKFEEDGEVKFKHVDHEEVEKEND